MRGAADTARDREIAAHTGWPAPLEQGRSVNCLRSLANGHLAFRILDQFSIGVVLLDQSTRVLFANAAAQSLSEKGGPLRVNSGVADFSSKHARRLGELVRSAVSDTIVRTMNLPSSNSGRALMVFVAPVKGDEGDWLDLRHLRSPAAILIVCDPGSPAEIPASWLTDAYGLTLGEIRVARTASSGATIADTARRLRISPNTVKTHLHRIYEKTGTSRQAELTRLMATIGLVGVGRPILQCAGQPPSSRFKRRE
jgi:DNA-binding CsgD family transcriptional regulator